MPSRWYLESIDVIEHAYKQAVRQGLCDVGIVAAIDAAYPFGERAMTPYKQWLAARRKMLAQLGMAQFLRKVKS